MPYVLTIDQGTTSTRIFLFDDKGLPIDYLQKEFQQFYPNNGWVEHDPEDLWHTVLELSKRVLEKTSIDINELAAIGIANQRETTLVWDATTGKPIYPAIVWQDRRSSKRCLEMYHAGLEPLVQSKTGLLIDPYFSAYKIEWILNSVPGALKKAEKGQLRFGTVDCFLLWRLTEGRVHATDATNASRTSLFNIHSQMWDKELLNLFNLPESLFPIVKDSADDFGETSKVFFGRSIPISAMAGDQQSALIGQACFLPGMIKSTYGTGCFMIANTGKNAIQSEHKLLTTVAYRLNNQVTYALEGSIFNAGAAVQWLRDALKLIPHAEVTESLAKIADKDNEVYLVPAFTGLGAPYWDPEARGALLGLTRNTGLAEVVAATLKSVAYQSYDLTQAMVADGMVASQLRVDGGMTANNWLMQALADVLGLVIERPRIIETTALGVTYLAGLKQGFFESVDEIERLWQREGLFEPTCSESLRKSQYQGWLLAVGRVRSG